MQGLLNRLSCRPLMANYDGVVYAAAPYNDTIVDVLLITVKIEAKMIVIIQ